MSSCEPLFSVLIANYNNGIFLQDAIDSILAQTYPNWEIVIVDDCSTDNSADLYKALEHNPKIHVFYNKKNFGAGFTKRRCVELAQGEVCGFVDPDDVLAAKDAIEVMVQTHLENPGASMVYSGYYDTDENLNVLKETPGTDLGLTSALESCIWPFRHFVSFKKESYNRTTGIDPLMKRAVDYDMYYKLEEVGDIIHLNRLLYKYRHNSNSISLNDGDYKSRIWHCYTCVEAMKRRNLTDEKLMLFPIEDALRREFNKGVAHAKQTKTYKLGEAITAPFTWLKSLFGK